MKNVVGIQNKLIRVAGRTKLLTTKHGPTILVGGGIISILGGTVMAIKATPTAMESKELYDLMKNDIHEVNNNREKYARTGTKYTDLDYRKDMTIMYVQRGVEYVKIYLPAIGLTTLGVAMVLTGHNILRRRHLAVAIAYTGVEKAFTEYRARVRATVGEKEEKDIYYGVKTVKVDTQTVEDNGKTKKVKKDILVAENGELIDPSIYSRFFDQSNANWNPTASTNKYFLRAQQNYFNDRLQAQGHVFLNEVYEKLGFPHTKQGAVVGWVAGEGDDHVDFGIFSIHANDQLPAYTNEWEPSILLDFNVHGVILDLI